MPRLPLSGGDDNTWGDILNDFLSQEHAADGSQKPLPQSKIINLSSDLSSKASAASAVTLTGTQTLTNKTLTSPAITAPTGIVKSDVGLGNVDNTSDANKPVSTAQSTALDAEATARANADTLLVSKSLVDAKGDLIVATANDTPARLAVGNDGQVLTADASAATGVAWAAGPPKAALDEPFTTDQLANYTANQGTSKTGLVVSGGVLSVSDANDHTFHNPNVNAANAKHIVKVTPNGNPHIAAILLKFIDNNNWLSIQGVSSNTTVSIVRSVAGSVSTTTITNSLPNLTEPYWLAGYFSGNAVLGAVYSVNPMLGNVPPAGSSLLTVAAALGNGVSGKPGLRLAGYNGAILTTTGCTLDDWVVVTDISRTSF